MRYGALPRPIAGPRTPPIDEAWQTGSSYEVLQTIEPEADPMWLAQFRELARLLSLRVE